MRCKKHISDRSSSVGVCATCLRERLFALIAAQALADETSSSSHRKSDATTHPIPPPPPPLIFPRSVSPYICRRSDDSSWNQHNHNDRRFYSTPQIGPTTTFISDSTITGRHNKKKNKTKFSLFTNLFKSSTTKSSKEFEPDPPNKAASTVSRASLSTTTTTSTSSPISSTWFSSMISGRRKKQSRLFSHDDSISVPPPLTTNRRPCHQNRGMSPSCENEEEDGGSPPSASGYSSESSNRKTQTTPAQPTRRKGHHHHHQSSQHSRNVSSMAFCLSPLVRASPHRSQKDIPPGGIGVSGEIGGGGGRVSSSSNKPHLSTAASFCANRSRKLANFGRSYNYNP